MTIYDIQLIQKRLRTIDRKLSEVLDDPEPRIQVDIENARNLVRRSLIALRRMVEDNRSPRGRRPGQPLSGDRYEGET